ncbi:MAG: rod shape-determining protein MreC [Planctomycetes bacterium]|nr:rod shape-determining protein MreC [Planctomycetota bacterium]
MRSHEKLSLRWFARHPLVATCILLALTVLLPFLRFGERIKLMALWPLAQMSGAPEADSNLTEEERSARDLAQAREAVARLAEERDMLARALADARAQSATDVVAFANVKLPQAVDARVVVRGDASSWRHSLVINRGRKQGIREGMPVVSGLTLVGRVFLAADEHAVVQLITDPGFAASCLVLDAKAEGGKTVRAILRGDGSQAPRFPKLELEDVEADAHVEKGMLVATSDFSGQTPAGLAVGEVAEVIAQSGFLEVRIKAYLNVEKLKVVQVLLHERPAIEAQALKLVEKKKR